MEKETWINDVLSSELNYNSPVSSIELFNKIQQRIHEEQATLTWALPIAAASLALLGLNILFLINQNNKVNESNSPNEFSYLTTSNQLYSHVEN